MHLALVVERQGPETRVHHQDRHLPVDQRLQLAAESLLGHDLVLEDDQIVIGVRLTHAPTQAQLAAQVAHPPPELEDAALVVAQSRPEGRIRVAVEEHATGDTVVAQRSPERVERSGAQAHEDELVGACGRGNGIHGLHDVVLRPLDVQESTFA